MMHELRQSFIAQAIWSGYRLFADLSPVRLCYFIRTVMYPLSLYFKISSNKVETFDYRLLVVVVWALGD